MVENSCQLHAPKEMFGQTRAVSSSGPAVQSGLAVVIVLLNICILLLLFTTRSIDDNRLTSWQWLFTQQQIYILMLLLAMILALLWKLVLPIRLKPEWGLFTAASVGGMLFWSEPEVIVDAARYFTQAKYLAEYGPVYFLQQWGHEIGAWTDLPLVPFLYGLLFKLFGESRLVIQLATTSMFAGTVVLTWFIGKTLWDDKLGLYAGGVLLAMPFLLTQVPLMLVDVPSMFFLTMAIGCSLQALNRGTSVWLLLAVIAVSMAVLSKYSTWLMLSVLPMIVIATRRKNRWQAGKRLLLILSGTGLLVAPLFLWKLDVFMTQWQLLTTYQVPGLQRWQESPLSTYFYQIHPFVSIAAIGSIYIAIQRRDSHFLIIAWMLLVIVVLDVSRSRYALIAFPMLALLAAYAVRQITDQRIRHYLLLSTIVASLLISLAGHRLFLLGSSAGNLQRAAAYIDGLDVPAVEVIVLPQHQSAINPLVSIPLLDLFTRQKVIYHQAPGLLSAPAPHILSTSPLRFSWEYRLPHYYTDHSLTVDRAIVVISSGVDQDLPTRIQIRLQHHRQSARFAQQDGVFRYTTIVTIYESSRSATIERPLT